VAVASGTVAAPALAAPSHRWTGRAGQSALVVALMLIGYAVAGGEYPWPQSLVWTQLPAYLNDFQGWLIDQRASTNPNAIFAIFDAFRAFADWLVQAFLDMFEWLTWVGTLAASVLIVLRFGGWRPALVVFFAFASFALMGLWEPSIQTLALMSAAVSLSLLIGVPLGVIAGRNRNVHRTITPVLDAMQIVPAFAYLMPVVILFSVGPAAAVICTMIYAVPPAVRITALGIRGVQPESVEAGAAMGATPWQLLSKVQLPLARRELLLSVNQTIMYALSLVVIAGLIGGRGLGDVVTNGLYSDAALALLAGIAIVIMAIALDRATHAIADRTDPTKRHLSDRGRKRANINTLITFGVIALIVAVCKLLGVAEYYPDEFETATTIYPATIQDDIKSVIQSVLDYVQDPTSFVFSITEPIGNFLVKYGLEPLRTLLVDTPVVHRAGRLHGAGVDRQRPAAGDHDRSWRSPSSACWVSGRTRWTPPPR
jgi:glycine betaine/proline transport system permease protein